MAEIGDKVMRIVNDVVDNESGYLNLFLNEELIFNKSCLTYFKRITQLQGKLYQYKLMSKMQCIFNYFG